MCWASINNTRELGRTHAPTTPIANCLIFYYLCRYNFHNLLHTHCRFWQIPSRIIKWKAALITFTISRVAQFYWSCKKKTLRFADSFVSLGLFARAIKLGDWTRYASKMRDGACCFTPRRLLCTFFDLLMLEGDPDRRWPASGNVSNPRSPALVQQGQIVQAGCFLDHIINL